MYVCSSSRRYDLLLFFVCNQKKGLVVPPLQIISCFYKVLTVKCCLSMLTMSNSCRRMLWWLR